MGALAGRLGKQLSASSSSDWKGGKADSRLNGRVSGMLCLGSGRTYCSTRECPWKTGGGGNFAFFLLCAWEAEEGGGTGGSAVRIVREWEKSRPDQEWLRAERGEGGLLGFSHSAKRI